MGIPATEKQIESSILDYLNTLVGCFAFKINTGGIFDPSTRRMRTITNKHQHKGTSDIIGVYKGRFFAIEVKRPKTDYNTKTYPSKDQKIFIQRVIDNGGVSGIARSIDDVIVLLKVFENENT
jgi:penicillin-binding protein-related factor A (putative recombinase)